MNCVLCAQLQQMRWVYGTMRQVGASGELRALPWRTHQRKNNIVVGNHWRSQPKKPERWRGTKRVVKSWHNGLEMNASAVIAHTLRRKERKRPTDRPKPWLLCHTEFLLSARIRSNIGIHISYIAHCTYICGICFTNNCYSHIAVHSSSSSSSNRNSCRSPHCNIIIILDFKWQKNWLLFSCFFISIACRQRTHNETEIRTKGSMPNIFILLLLYLQNKYSSARKRKNNDVQKYVYAITHRTFCTPFCCKLNWMRNANNKMCVCR